MEFEYSEQFECETCGSNAYEALGCLGSRVYVRCRACGMDHFLCDPSEEEMTAQDYHEEAMGE